MKGKDIVRDLIEQRDNYKGEKEFNIHEEARKILAGEYVTIEHSDGQSIYIRVTNVFPPCDDTTDLFIIQGNIGKVYEICENTKVFLDE